MNYTIKYNTNESDVETRIMGGVQPPEIAANAFLQVRHLDGALALWIPLGRLASIEFEHDLVQPATAMPTPGSKLSLV